jgi:hypothetical protein
LRHWREKRAPWLDENLLRVMEPMIEEDIEIGRLRRRFSHVWLDIEALTSA